MAQTCAAAPYNSRKVSPAAVNIAMTGMAAPTTRDSRDSPVLVSNGRDHVNAQKHSSAVYSRPMSARPKLTASTPSRSRVPSSNGGMSGVIVTTSALGA